MNSIELTTAQAIISFLSNQYVERDGQRNPFFAGCWGIFGHGNVAGIGQALEQFASVFPYFQSKNEQAQVHIAAAFAKASNRLRTFAVTSSIGPGATNMLTGAAAATINRLPVLLLPGDIFVERVQAPVLQQLEVPYSQDISVNDCFKPVSRYWDRISRPEQLLTALPEAMRVLTSPAETGAVTLSLPQDVQTYAHHFPAAFFEPRTWIIPRNRADRSMIDYAAHILMSAARPVIIAGGGVHFSQATATLASFAERHGIPVVETQAGKGALPFDARMAMGAAGATGTSAAVTLMRDADVVFAIGTRLSDFTTASKTAFQHPNVKFIGINVVEMDAYKHNALPLIGDARAVLEDLTERLGDWQTAPSYQSDATQLAAQWNDEVQRIYDIRHGPPMSQGEVIGMLNELTDPSDVIICAAGSLPGDLHKLWRTRSDRGYHLEYGYSTMGYEIPAGLGVKLALPDRDAIVVVGDGSYLMMHTELVTMVQERIKVIIVMLDNSGFASIGGLSQSVGSEGFGTEYRRRSASGRYDAETLAIDFAANMRSLGVRVIEADSHDTFASAIAEAKRHDGGPVAIVTRTDRNARVPGSDAWWDVAVAEVSDKPAVQDARKEYLEKKRLQRAYFPPTKPG
ncbi:MAG: 3D-(3,5/4)-trihydroxycyclohexane-1,2-dione acylhydrolase (decyclizing) [Anaerolineae bacterium]|nr:3D-(3,5/4)-trihydroxycyclohexane-1,2-dione acylhydrolase (decyclizing) [Anaerolineae bacterium]